MNKVSLTACVVQLQSLRYTPAGVPAINLVLEHESELIELDTPRIVKVQLKAIAFGALAETMSRQPLEISGTFHGFLANARNGKGVTLHIQEFSKIQGEAQNGCT